MLGAACVIPLIVGVIATRMLAPEQRPQGATANLVAVANGYPYTVALALTLVVMTALAPIVRIRTFFKRWSTRHVPVIVESAPTGEVATPTPSRTSAACTSSRAL